MNEFVTITRDDYIELYQRADAADAWKAKYDLAFRVAREKQQERDEAIKRAEAAEAAEARAAQAERQSEIYAAELDALAQREMRIRSERDGWKSAYTEAANELLEYANEKVQLKAERDAHTRTIERLLNRVETVSAERDAFADQHDIVHNTINQMCGTDTSTFEAVQHVIERRDAARRELEQAQKQRDEYNNQVVACMNHMDVDQVASAQAELDAQDQQLKRFEHTAPVDWREAQS